MSQRHQIQENTKVLMALNPVDSAAGANNGTGIDTLAHEEFREILTLVVVGTDSGTPDSFSVAAKLQESSDDSTYTDVTGASMTAITADNQVGQIYLDAKSLTKRYFRVVVTPAFVNGSTPKIELSAVHILHNFRERPQS